MPNLTVSAKRGKTQTLKFEVESITIGKDPACHLCLRDDRISPLQAIISYENGKYILRNKSGKSPTMVNGLPSFESELLSGDEITLGGTSILFEIERDEERTRAAREMVEVVPPESLQTTFDASLPRDDHQVLSPAGEARAAQTLEAIYQAGKIIHSIHDPDELVEKLVHLLLDVTRASRACFLAHDRERKIYPKAVFSRDKGGKEDKILISQSIVSEVERSGSGILCTNASLDNRFKNATSISLGKIRSALCVPVNWKEKTFGLLYLDARGFTRDFTSFNNDDLRLVKAIAGQAALALDNAYHEAKLVQENISLKRQGQMQFGMVAISPRMQKIAEAIVRVAPSDSTILLRGETGTGKEVVARAIHFNSLRKDKLLIAVNCAAFPETLLQSELFGHEKGAFTGAIGRKIGKFELAQGGTIFLDEIAELDPKSQVVLLRILEEKKLQRLGSNQDIPVDARVIAATNRDLGKAIASGKFREDLYYRLKVVELFLPPLRERKEEIETLIDFYLAYFVRQGFRRVEGIEPEALELLKAHHWPGNVRELKNALERVLVLGSSPRITCRDLSFISARYLPGGQAAGEEKSIHEIEKEHILEVLRQTNGNKKLAAAKLGINRATLHRKIKAYGIPESDR